MSESSGPRVIFLDFDGTYAHHAIVPDAHVDAVRRARAGGHHVLLCTGRPLSILDPRVTDAFDGVVSSAGARVDLPGVTLCDHRVEPDVARRAVDVLERHGAFYCLEAPDAMYTPHRGIDHLRAKIGALMGAGEQASTGGSEILDALVVPDDLRAVSWAKVSVWDSPVGTEQLAAEIGPELRALPNALSGDASRSGELQATAIDKADGVRLVAEHLGLELASTVAVGDGMNDVGMLTVAGVAVGIEGAASAVLDAADLVVPRPRDHGLVVAFERLGLI